MAEIRYQQFRHVRNTSNRLYCRHIDWKQKEQLERMTPITTNMCGGLHPSADIRQLHLSPKGWGKRSVGNLLHSKIPIRQTSEIHHISTHTPANDSTNSYIPIQTTCTGGVH